MTKGRVRHGTQKALSAVPSWFLPAAPYRVLPVALWGSSQQLIPACSNLIGNPIRVGPTDYPSPLCLAKAMPVLPTPGTAEVRDGRGA